MTKIRTALAALVVVASVVGAAPAFAQNVPADGDSADERKCVFVAELGGYRCEDQTDNGSLADGADGSDLIVVIGIPIF